MARETIFMNHGPPLGDLSFLGKIKTFVTIWPEHEQIVLLKSDKNCGKVIKRELFFFSGKAGAFLCIRAGRDIYAAFLYGVSFF